MEKHAIVVFVNIKTGLQLDLELPLNITANELYSALNEVFHLNTDNNGYLKSENPINFLKGNKTLGEYGIHDGTVILYS